jgi:hypothetical protein
MRLVIGQMDGKQYAHTRVEEIKIVGVKKAFY